MKKKFLQCDYCGKFKPDVERRADPFEQEINEVDEFYNLCDECYDKSAEEI